MGHDHKKYAREFRQKQRDDRNEVGTLPKIQDRRLRNAMLKSLEVFLSKGFAHIFTDPFGPVQKSSIKEEQQILESGGRHLNKLEPRGYGKSVRSDLGLTWASLKGVQRFSLICQDSKEKADDMLQLLHLELGANEILLACFPELKCFQHLDGNPHKAKYQTYKGKKTEISIKGDTIRFPKLAGFKSSGAIIAARPYRKARGKNIEAQRPTIIVLDDVQTTEQAGNPQAVKKNLKTLRTDIAYLGDRKNPISIINNATIIEPEDFPHTLTQDRSFRTVRYKMVEKFPSSKKAKELWKQYEQIRISFDESVKDDDLRAYKAALAFYKKNRKSMDAGSSVTWDYAFSKKPHDYEISTLQAAYNFIMDYGEDSFRSECQNDPPQPDLEDGELTRDRIQKKQHGQPKGVVPNEAEKLVVDVDVQGEYLYYTILAGSTKFDAFVIEKAAFPDQKRKYFSKNKLFHKFSDRYKGTNEEGRIYRGILEFLAWIFGREFNRHGDGARIPIDVLGIDTQWNSDIVQRAIRDFGDPRVFAYSGYGIGPTRAPMDTWKKKPGDQKGVHWHLRAAEAGVRRFVSDVNFWKSFVEQHLLIPIGQEGSLSLYKVKTPKDHALYADHIKAEVGSFVVDEGSGRRVRVWKQIPGQDNEGLDTLAGACALLSYAGASCLGASPKKPKRSKQERNSVKYF